MSKMDVLVKRKNNLLKEAREKGLMEEQKHLDKEIERDY